MSEFLHVTKENFESEVLRSPIPVLVDLYADWCGPCRMLAQVLDRVAPQLQGRVKIVKIDTEDQPKLAQAFRVSSIPLLVLIHEGKVVNASVGLLGPQQVLSMVEKVAPAAVPT